MERRNLAACDQCHRLKLKCIPLLHECSRCARLGLQCKTNRERRKRGRKPTAKSPGSDQTLSASDGVEYPVLQCLVASGICEAGELVDIKTDSLPPLCSIWTASRMLDHLYASPNQEFYSGIIRKSLLFDIQNPRPTSPALLCSMLCLACYVPRNDDLVSVLNTSHGELVTLRRAFISRTMRLLEPVMLGQAKLTFDDAVTAIMLCSIGASEDSTDKHQSQWLSFTFLAIRKLGPEIEDEVSDEEVNEEHRRFVELFISAHLFSEVNIQCDIRRLWWSVYMLDRHVALSFNIRPQLTDQQCQNLQVPCPDAIWASLTPLERNLHANNAVHRGIGYTVRSLDEFELLVPLMSILGDILEYHHLRQHTTFNTSTQFLSEVRQNIELNLQVWNKSLQPHLSPFARPDPIQSYSYTTHDSSLYDSNNPAISMLPKIVLYAKHLYHCMHILLYGKMDFVSMYSDLEWQASPDFLAAGEHANRCAELAESILVIDKSLFLMYRLFGTYLLQSSFFFLILANKLGSDADKMILKNCSINLQVLDAFVKLADIAYQKTFVGFLRRTLERIVSRDGDWADGGLVIDEELMQYRWIGGYHGLWSKDRLVSSANGAGSRS